MILVFTSQLFFEEPWLDVHLEPLLKETVAAIIVVVVLGACFWLTVRLEQNGKQTQGAVIFGMATALLTGALLLGIWVDQKTDGSSESGSAASLPAPTQVPAPNSTAIPEPTPLPTPTPTPGPTDITTTLTRSPYLGNCSTESVTVGWKTDVAATSSVKYGTTPLMDSQQADANTRFQHAVTLHGLEPDTKYFYQVISNRQAMAPPSTFTTNQSAISSDFSFSVFGDTGVGGLPQFGIASQLMDVHSNFLLHTGDVIYHHRNRAHLIEMGLVDGYDFNPPLTDFEAWDSYYFLPYRDIVKSKCIFTSLGNHDCPKCYTEALHLPSNNPANSEIYYSFNYGRAHIIALDSNQSAGKPGHTDTAQFMWLREDLRNASQDPEIDWIFVFFHHAPFASGPVNIDPISRGRFMADFYVPLFEEFGVDVVFGGHDHVYERTCPMIKNSCAPPDKRGILYIVTGGGGHPQLEPNICEADCLWSQFRLPAFHFVQVNVQGDNLTGEAIGIDGKVFDTFSVEPTP